MRSARSSRWAPFLHTFSGMMHLRSSQCDSRARTLIPPAKWLLRHQFSHTVLAGLLLLIGPKSARLGQYGHNTCKIKCGR